MKNTNESALRESFKAALERDRNPEAVISVILELLTDEALSAFQLKNTFIVVKEELITYFYGQSISAELLFNKMWRHRNCLIQLMSTFLIPVFFKPNSFWELKAIVPRLRSLSNMQLTRLTGYNLGRVLKRRPNLAVSFIRILTTSENIWIRLLALHLGEELETGQNIEIMSYIRALKNDPEILLKKYTPFHFQTDEEILNSIQKSWVPNGNRQS